NVFVSATFVFVRCYLASGDIHLFHQLPIRWPVSVCHYIDRLRHNAHRLKMKGESMRKRLAQVD
ncbi:hypothetical protein ACZ87_02823, partial [Candidatus Erwinia dacicola]